MATILLLIAALLAVTSAVCMVWIRMAAADHRQRWNVSDTQASSVPEELEGDGLGGALPSAARYEQATQEHNR